MGDVMSDKFVASNGATIQKGGAGNLFLEHPEWNGYRLYPDHVAALREFFQYERDEELGRWRDPENPDVVVYRTPYGDDRDGRRIEMVNERTNETEPAWENLVVIEDAEQPEGWAARYFAAHPEPKPWHDAKPGEVWLIGVPTGPTFEFSAMTAVEHDGKIAFSNPGSDEWLAPTYEPLSARRIWPEVSDVAE